MRFTILSIYCFIATTLAMPLSERAGGPVSTPQPAGCTVVEALPSNRSLFAASTPGDTSGWKLSDEFNSTYLLYQSYYQSSQSIQASWDQCVGQCYGYGTQGTCKSAILAYDVPIPAGYYGSKGGVLSQIACILFSEYATPLDFEPAPSGQYINETAASVYCLDTEE